MNLVALDTETTLIGKDSVVPQFICAQVAMMEDNRTIPMLVTRMCPNYKDIIIEILSDDDNTFVLHNAAFDMSVLAKEIPEALPLIWKAYDEGRIHDTMIREMLYNLTSNGDIDMIELNGVKTPASYSLAALTKMYTGVDRSAVKDAEDSVRLFFSEVMNTPLEDWPEEYVKYAEDDPCDTLIVFLEQEIQRKKLIERIGYDPFVTESFRNRVHFSLQLMTAHGNKLDAVEVLRVTEEFNTLYNDPELVLPLVLSKFIESYAEANGVKLTEQVMNESLAAYDSLSEMERDSWEGTGIVIPAVPPTPYANGAKDHLIECVGHKENPYYNGKQPKDCTCPPKMKAGAKECGSDKELHRYIWKAALDNELLEVWASESTEKLLKEEKLAEQFLERGNVINQKAVVEAFGSRELPEKWRISVDAEWLASYALLDPILEKLATRRKYQKIITSYLPGLYWKEGASQCLDILEGETDRLAGKQPADVVHSCFRPLKLTGRTSSHANTKGVGAKKAYLFPSMNGQQVDPRIRPCIVPREGYKLFSIDYSGMELGTAAQKCINLFGYSVLADVINSGRSAHTYLGAFIAREIDPWFTAQTVGMSGDEMYKVFAPMAKLKDPCASDAFAHTWAIKGHTEAPTLADFFKYYRTFAKPTGLGYPGGLGPKTFVAYAKATYGVSVDLELAAKLREIWKGAFPEMREYLDYVGKRCFDINHRPEQRTDDDGKEYLKKFYSYDTALGMHRAKCDFCSCANGQALQSDSAEGALLGLSEIMRGIFAGSDEILRDHGDVAGVRPTIFIHDEIFGEIRDDEFLTARIKRMKQIMKECMEIITPNVLADTEEALMNRWSKAAFAYYDENGNLRPYEEAAKKEKK